MQHIFVKHVITYIYEGLRMKEPLFNIDKGAAGVWSFPVLNLFFGFYLFSF